MNDFDLLIKRASKELERVFQIEPYSDNLVVALGSWRANHNREAMEVLIRKYRKTILGIEGNFEDVMSYLIDLIKNILLEN